MLAPGPAPPELSLYLHIPWCRARCGYCDFNTYVADTTDRSVTEPYLAALLTELALAASAPDPAQPGSLGQRVVSTIYVGGGTPTLLAPGDYQRLLQAIRDHFPVAPDAEITTEANPETLSPAQLAQLRAAGVNRLSLGMQSAVEHVLAVLDRAHTPGRVAQGVAWARAAGFDNLSLDLIYGAPGESLADWRISLESALTLAPDHLSAYSLIVEPATPLARRLAAGELDLPDDDDLADKYLLADQLLSTAGLTWYEVSNWATPGMACRHNLSYWRGADWWGLGAGAHSHLAGHRWWNLRRPAAYTARLAAGRPPQAGSEHLTPAQRHTEAVMLGLRLAEGLDSGLLSDPEQSRAEEHRQRGHLARHGDRLVCTLPGRLIADALVRDILD